MYPSIPAKEARSLYMLSRVIIKAASPEATEKAQKLQDRAESVIIGLCAKYGIDVPPKENRDENWYGTFVTASHR